MGFSAWIPLECMGSVCSYSCFSPVPSALLTTAAPRNHRRGKGEGIGEIDAFSALDLPLGRWVERADVGGRKEGIVSASWHQW